MKINYCMEKNGGKMKKVLFFNHIPLAGKKPEAGWRIQLENTGNNTGNCLFVESMKEQVNYSLELWFADSNCYDSLINRAVGVLPLANLIGVHDNCAEIWSELISKVPFPIVPVGMGAQSTKELNTPQKLVNALPKSKVYAIKAMADRVKSIGIRGEFTAQCLDNMGIRNYRIIGCPSAYKYLCGEYKEIMLPTSDRVVCNITTGNKYESKLLKLGIENECDWIMQTANELPEVCLDEKNVSREKIERVFPELDIEGGMDRLYIYSKKHGNMFCDIMKWYDFLEQNKFTFSFGSRFHGNMIALRTGIPALWVIHDSRTKELVETFSLPHLNYEQLDIVKNIDELMDYCDYKAFYKKYKQQSKEYVKFLEENEISHRFTCNY